MSLRLEAAVKELSVCIRDELRDHAFNDREISWVRPGTNDLVAVGYAGSEYSVEFCHKPSLSFEGDEAFQLISVGITGVIERNDTTGVDIYRNDPDA